MRRLRRWSGRPLAEHERALACTLTALLLMLAAVALAATAPRHDTPPAARATPPATIAGRPAANRRADRADAPGRARRSAERFLHGYLAYLYGRAPARAIHPVTAGLRRRLAATPARVAPGARRRHPRVRRLALRALAAGHGWLASATIQDGGRAGYRLELLLGRRADGRVRVRAVGAH